MYENRNQQRGPRNNNFNNNSNREPKKDWRRRTTHQPNGYPKNLRVEIPVSCYGFTTDGKEYDGTSFIDMMDDLQKNDTFSKISIPVYTKASYILEDKPDAKWRSVIGYIKEFNEDGNAVCIIYTKSIKVFQSIKDPIILPRVAIKDGRCVCIVGLDVLSGEDARK